MGLSKEKGQITVFLSIILLALIVLAGVLIDASRIRTGEAQARRAVEVSAKSALAKYNSKLKNEYGIFSLSVNDEEKLKGIISDYTVKNLLTAGIDKNNGKGGYEYLKKLLPENQEDENSRFIRLFDYKVEEIRITPVFNLSENEVARSQILEYMKYRAPVKVIENIWTKLSAVKEASKMSEAYKKKTSVDRLMGAMATAQENLKKCIEAANSFKPGETIEEFSKAAAENNILKVCREKLEAEISSLRSELARLVSEDAGREKKQNSDRISELRSRINLLENIRSHILGKMDTNLKLIQKMQKNINELQASHNNALKYIDKISEVSRKAKEENKKLEDYIAGELKGEHEVSKDFKETISEDTKRLNELILNGENAESLTSVITGNLRYLDALEERLESALHMECGKTCGEIGSISDVDNFVNENIGGLKKQISDYITTGLSGMSYNNSIFYKFLEYKSSKKWTKEDDTRKKYTSEAKNKVKDKDNDEKSVGEELLELLPSKNKKTSQEFSEEDAAFLKNMSSFNHGLGTVKALIPEGEGTKYDGDLKDIGSDIDLREDEDSNFPEKAFDFMGSMGTILAKELVGLRDELYINEYIVGTFKSAVPSFYEQENKNGSPRKKEDTDLRSIPKKERDTFFDCEVEYVLHGNPSQKLNKSMTMGQLLLLRFGMDTLHVYTDSAKRQTAVEIATAVSGWWTAGAGIPVLSNLIMCGWGMGEAIWDLSELMDGKSVPFYKKKGDWHLDIIPGFNTGGSGEKTDKALYFNYQDYLRLFLLFKGSEEKMNRIEDLIQLNIQKNNKGFKLSEHNTYLRIEAVVSMNYLFMTQPFIPKDKKINGRHKFSILIYQGY